MSIENKQGFSMEAVNSLIKKFNKLTEPEREFVMRTMPREYQHPAPAASAGVWVNYRRMYSLPADEVLVFIRYEDGGRTIGDKYLIIQLFRKGHEVEWLDESQSTPGIPADVKWLVEALEAYLWGLEDEAITNIERKQQYERLNTALAAIKQQK